MEAFRDPFPQLAVWRQNVPTEALRFSRDLDKAIARYTNPRKRTFYDRQFVRTVTLGKPDALIFVVPTAEEFSEESFAIERSKGHLRIYMKTVLEGGTLMSWWADFERTSFGMVPRTVLSSDETEVPNPDPHYHSRDAIASILGEVLLEHRLLRDSSAAISE